MSDQNDNQTASRKITIRPNGPYVVKGNVPLVRKTQVVSEYGEPLTWRKDGDVESAGEEYHLCRCGGSEDKPYCDSTHKWKGFNGTETALTDGPSDYRFDYRGTLIIVTKDPTLCMNSGFCGMKDTEISQLVAESGDTKARSLAIAMVERCPSGALTYRIKKGDPDIEPDLPQQVALTTEVTSSGPIMGPYWVTGNLEIERSDGKEFQPRNRVTLCNCGHSDNKPLCDGTHRTIAEREARK